jgi:uncharacterized protein with GYD domain
MPLFLARFGYTPEAWAGLVKDPQNREEAIRPVVEAAGAKLQGFWYAFGECDGYILIDAPDTVSIASISTATSASGALRLFETTALITVDEMVEALKKASELPYRAPMEAHAMA